MIIDAMAVHQGMTKTAAMSKLCDLQEAFIKLSENMSKSYDELRVICDRYQDPPLKNKTRQKRLTSRVEYQVLARPVDSQTPCI